MAESVVGILGRLEIRQARGRDPLGHAAGAQESVEVAVLALALIGGVGVVVELRVGLGIENITVGIMVPLEEGLDILDQLADDIVAGLGQHPVAVDDHLGRLGHGFESLAGQMREIFNWWCLRFVRRGSICGGRHFDCGLVHSALPYFRAAASSS